MPDGGSGAQALWSYCVSVIDCSRKTQMKKAVRFSKWLPLSSLENGAERAIAGVDVSVKDPCTFHTDSHTERGSVNICGSNEQEKCKNTTTKRRSEVYR